MNDITDLANLLAQTYTQGRLDTIDEIKQWLYKHLDVNYTTMLLFLDDLEQLMEKKHE